MEEVLKKKEDLNEVVEDNDEQIEDGSDRQQQDVDRQQIEKPEIKPEEEGMGDVTLKEEDHSEVAPEEVEEPQEKMLTQSQVNELVGRARQEGRMSAIKEMVDRYGVGNESELDDVFGRGQAYDSLNDDFVSTNQKYNEVMAENALLKSHVDMNRWEDIKLILGGKGLEITEENIEALLPSHPEWRGVVENEKPFENGIGDASTITQNQQKPSVLQKLGEDVSPKEEEETEEEKVRKWYGI